MSSQKIDRCTLRSVAVLLGMPIQTKDTIDDLRMRIQKAFDLEKMENSPLFKQIMVHNKESLVEIANKLKLTIPKKFTKKQIAQQLYPHVLLEMQNAQSYQDFED